MIQNLIIFFVECEEKISTIQFVKFDNIMAEVDSIFQNRDISDKLKLSLGFSE